MMKTLGAFALLACLLTCGGRSPGSLQLPQAPALENPRGIIGGPQDETAFEFEPEPATLADEPPVLDGVPEIPEQILDGLKPYLAARQTRIALVESEPMSILVLTRMGEVSQVYRVSKPMGVPKQLTSGSDPIAQVAGDGKCLVFRRDRNGDEKYQIYELTLANGRERLLTDGASRHGGFAMTRKGLAFSNNQRTSGDMDVYVAPLGDPLRPLHIAGDGGQWTVGAWSRDGARLLVRHYRSADSSSTYIAELSKGTLTPIDLGKGEAVVRDVRFTSDPSKLFLVSDAGEDVAGLYELNLETGATRSLSAGISWDVELLAVSQDQMQLAFVANEDGFSELYFVDVSTGERHHATGLPSGVITSLQFVGKTPKVALTMALATRPADVYLYDRATESLERWTQSSDPVLDEGTLSSPEVVRVKSVNDVEVPAFVYKPKGPGPFPVLLWIHGGPEAQHRPSFDPLLQYLVAEQGIAVVAPNIRGSTGYGRAYLSLDDGMRRGDAVRDIGAVLDWIDGQPDLDAARVGIYGASYGGFIVLASLVEYGERLAAGCDLVGISHFVRFLENTSEYRRDLRRPEYGDERDPETRAFLEAISPLTNASKIRTPLFVAHGANDPRVPVQEAEQIVTTVREQGTPVWYFLARDEGHGFRKRRSRDLFYAAMTTFFATHLLGDDQRTPPPATPNTLP